MTLEETFTQFCAFGAGAKGSAPMMENSKYAKLFRDMKLYDKKLTNTDTDIIFNKVKAKTDRKINFDQFKEALKQSAEKKYPGDAEGYNKLVKKIEEGSGPKASGTTKQSSSGGVDRMTDTSKYTGSHKERFDESGKGKGIEGRKDRDAKAAEGYVGGYKGKDTYDKK